MLLCACAMLVCMARAEEPDHAKILDGMLARAKLPFSGAFAYDVETGFPQIPGKELSKQSLEYVFFGDSWLSRPRGSNSLRLSHAGLYVFLAWSRSDATPLVRVQIEHGRPHNPDHALPPTPTVIGTLWYPGPLKHIESHKNDYVYKGPQQIGGVTSHVYEWPISEKETGAFTVVGPYTRQGGLIRIWVAPEFGYATPRVEYVAHLNEKELVAIRFACEDFVKVADGLYFPRKCSRESFDDAGCKYFCRLLNITWAKVNEEIGDEHFRINVPKGTGILDLRGGQRRQYTYEAKAMLPPDLQPVFTDTPVPEINYDRAASWWRMAGWMAVGLSLVLFAGLIALRWRRVKTAQPLEQPAA
jgi:hypothetical protein